jgi:hypothetical protein
MRDVSKLMVLLSVLLIALPFSAGMVAADTANDTIPYVPFRDQLDPNGQAAYDAFESLTSSTVSSPFTVNLANPVYTKGMDAEAAGKYLDNVVKEFLNSSFYATSQADPMAFWSWGDSYFGYELNKTTVVAEEVTYIGVESVKVTILMDSFYADDPSTVENELQKKIDELKAAVEAFTTTEKTQNGIASAVNSHLVSTVTYDPEAKKDGESPCAHDAYGALVGTNGHKYAVCDGYSEAYQLLCAKYDVKAIVVAGTANEVGHAWNAVLIDGSWYGVDSTWNTKSSSPYLLVGHSTSDNGVTFSQSHSAGISTFYDNGGLYTPTLSENHYGYTAPTWFDNYGTWLLSIPLLAVFLYAIYRLMMR